LFFFFFKESDHILLKGFYLAFAFSKATGHVASDDQQVAKVSPWACTFTRESQYPKSKHQHIAAAYIKQFPWLAISM
jgi:hypothetical protein